MTSSSPVGGDGPDFSINSAMSAAMSVGKAAENGGSPPGIKSPAKPPGPNRIGRRNQVSAQASGEPSGRILRRQGEARPGLLGVSSAAEPGQPASFPRLGEGSRWRRRGPRSTWLLRPWSGLSGPSLSTQLPSGWSGHPLHLVPRLHVR
ncbi:Ras-responsive element-binding protein 1 [Galemys pyrenaicus]|uniref:Ras-responsive element-binding protein 1 n=1 Tax=Galemys pyrenaicus TaxID=202257 RepID=A0A8J6DLT5_GALPY|nr:Ras-responsive element-binding protein 1 [Galemys pyrenaicus]